MSFTNNVQQVLPASSAGVVSNGLFPSTIVGSSVSVGTSPVGVPQSPQGSSGFGTSVGLTESERLPPGSAGFGTVEPIDLGSVFINPTQQTLNSFQPQNQALQVVPSPSSQSSFGSSNQNSFGSSNQNSFGSSNQGSFGQSFTPLQQQSAGAVEQSQESFLRLTNEPQQQGFQNQNFNSIQSQNLNTFQQSQNIDVLPSYGQSADTNVNIAVLPSSQGSFGPTFSPNDDLPTYGSRPQSDGYSQNFFPSNGNALPNYGQPQSQQSTILNNQFSNDNFQSSISNNQAWRGANQLSQNGNQLPNFNGQRGQSNLTPTFSAGSNDNERPVRFPGDASNRFDVDTSYENYDRSPFDSYEQYTPEASSNVYNNEEQLNYYNNAQQTIYYNPQQQQQQQLQQQQQQQVDYYNSQEQQQYYNPSTPTPNIVAELTKYSKKTNLVHKPRSDSSYISYPSSHEMEEPDKELIFYPSGQLIVGQSPNIGPNLRQHLLSQQNSYKHDQAPHYVFARKKQPSYEGKTELFDPMLEGDELIERSDKVSDESEAEGLLPVLIRTAKDDFKLVGDVLKMAFSKR